MNIPKRFVGASMLLVASLAIVACGSSKSSSTTQTSAKEGAESPILVEAGEFFFKADLDGIKPGKVTFKVTNNGKTKHEMVIYKLKKDEKADNLEMQSDKSTPDAKDEESEGKGSRVVENEDQNMGEVESDELGPGETGTVTVDLKPGRYMLLCNLPGHYKSGMFKAFEVS